MDSELADQETNGFYFKRKYHKYESFETMCPCCQEKHQARVVCRYEISIVKQMLQKKKEVDYSKFIYIDQNNVQQILSVKRKKMDEVAQKIVEEKQLFPYSDYDFETLEKY